MISSAVEKVFANSLQIDSGLKRTMQVLQAHEYFLVRIQKDVKFRALRGRGVPDTLVVCRRKLSALETADVRVKVEFVDGDFLAPCDADELRQRVEFLRGKMFLCTNTEIQAPPDIVASLRAYQHLYHECDQTLFLGWDWDNHHHLHISSIFALNTDFYFPSHRANDYDLSRMGANMFHIPLSGHQWTRETLMDHIDVILQADRTVDVFGNFVKYALFPYRNQVITTLNAAVPSIRLLHVDPPEGGPASPDAQTYKKYQEKSDREKIAEWSSAKWHWVVPTLNDLSTRVFDALQCGTGVVLPNIFRGFKELSGLDPRDIVWHSDLDITDPTRVIREIREKYVRSGKDGILRRHRIGTDLHVLGSRVQTMLDCVQTAWT